MTPKTLTYKGTILGIALLGVMGACGDENAQQPALVKADAPVSVKEVTAPVESAREFDSGGPAEPSDPPKKALEITDPNVVPYGVRVRVTRGSWDFLRLTLRDSFKQWGSPKRDATGINFLLDPGYDYQKKNAGFLRTTPLLPHYAHRPGFRCAFGDCPGGDLLNARPDSIQWLQVRKYGPPGSPCNADNTISGNDRGVVDAILQSHQREHGFYVADEGQCYKETNICTPSSKEGDINKPHVGHDPMAKCEEEVLDTGTLNIKAEINLGVFIFPHGGVESRPTAAEPYDPLDIGTYTGLSSHYGLRTAGPRKVSERCFFGRCKGSKDGWWWVSSKFPSANNFNIFGTQHKSKGSYLYQGDDQAIYMNVNQMQVQSILRSGASDAWFQIKEKQRGYCLSVRVQTPLDNSPLVYEPCSSWSIPPDRQLFQYDFERGRLKSKAGNASRCVSYASLDDGAALRLYTCNGGPNYLTEIEFVDGYIKSRGPIFALQANENGTFTQEEYKGTPDQAWELVESGDQGSYWKRLRTDYKSRCAVVRPDNDVRHTRCSNVEDDPAAFWIYNPNDETWRTALDFDKCMDVEGADFSNNTQILVWPCHGGDNQRWYRNNSTKVIFSRGGSLYCINGHKDDDSYEKVQIYRYQTGSNEHCTGNRDNEQWNIDIAMSDGEKLIAFGYLRDRATGKCLQLYGAYYTRMADCVMNDNTQWMYDENTLTLRPKGSPTRCLDHMGYQTPGAALIIEPCGKAGRVNYQKFDRQGDAFVIRNGVYLTGGISTPKMQYFRIDDSQLFETIYVKQVVNYEPQMHDCGDFMGRDKVYTGQVDANGEPIYFDTVVRQCLRPKSYWHGYPNICAAGDTRAGCLRHGEPKQRWIPCDPFDTFKANGEYNPDRDDLFTLYPYPYGPQSLLCGAAASVHDPGNAGWYGLKIDGIKLNPDTVSNWELKNTIEVNLSARDLRIEMGLWADVNLIGGPAAELVNEPRRQWALLNARIKKLSLRPKIKLYSIDSSSCQTTGGFCEEYWNPWNNRLTDPDRIVVDLILEDEDISFELDSPAFDLVNAKGNCLVHVYLYLVSFCAYDYDKFLDTVMGELGPNIVKVLKPAIEDQVKAAVEGIPNLNTIFGDPIDFGSTLIDYGLYMTPEAGDYLAEPAPEGGRKWPVRVFSGPGGGREVTDLRLAVGMKPIAFKLPADSNPNGLLTVDTNDPPDEGSVYGVPTLVDPDTSTCVQFTGTNYKHTILASGTYTYSNQTGELRLNVLSGNFSDIRENYEIRNTANGKLAKILKIRSGYRGEIIYTLKPGLAADFGSSGNFAIDKGILTNMSFHPPGTYSQLKVNQVFRDESTQAAAKILEDHSMPALGVYKFIVDTPSSSDFNGGAFATINCSRDSRYPAPDEDQGMDSDDYVVTGSFTDPHTGIRYDAPQVIPEYWKGPIAPEKRAPKWCSSPQELRAFSSPEKLAALYPQKTWLSFDSTYDKKASGGPATPRNTVGNWDSMPGFEVLRQNANDGSIETNDVGYDVSLHLHQRTMATLLQSLIASGATCLEFSAFDEAGSETPWKSLLSTDRFAAFLPGLTQLFPNQHVSVRIFPTRAPHVRTGVGRLTFTPKERLANPNDSRAPLPIVNEPYTLGIALPDLRIEFWVQDSQTETELRLVSMYWSPVVGFFAKNVRACFHLDPLAGTPACTSNQVNERTVSGYYEMFLDLNAPALQAAFENPTDGFAAGAFTRTDEIGIVRGESPIVIDSRICEAGRCDTIGLSQALPTLLSSVINVFVVTRLQFMDMSLDFLYVGADGPNDDNVPIGAPGGRVGGDYLGIYARFLGKMNILDLMGPMSLAPGAPMRVAKVQLPAFAQNEAVYFNTNTPAIAVSLDSPVNDGQSVNSYTYAVNDGFWHTPVTDSSLRLGALTEGEHKLAIRVINDSAAGAIAQKDSTEVRFRIDTVAPIVGIGAAKSWGWQRHIPVSVSDLQTPAGEIFTTYSINGGKAVAFKDNIPWRKLQSGRNVVKVTAFDLAGNETTASKVFHQTAGCNSSQSAGLGSLLLWLSVAGSMALRRRSRPGRMPG